METRICNGKCGLEKELNEINFYPEAYGENNEKKCFAWECKACQSDKRKSKYVKRERVKKIKPIELTRICSGPCGLEKELNASNFYWRSDSNRFRSDCIDCRSLKDKQYNQKNSAKKSAKNKKNWQENTEECKALNKKQYKKHKKIRIATQQQYYQENKEEILERQRLERIENGPKFKAREARRRKNTAIKIKNDPIRKLRKNISRNINLNIKRNLGCKNGESISNYLFYTIKQLMMHLQFQFEDWMNWKNRGTFKINGDRKWHIDHIIPQIQFPYASMDCLNFYRCWSLSNLRPLDAVLNLKKGYNISDELYNETIAKINLELEARAEIDPEFKTKLEKWKLEEELDNQEQLKKVG